MATLKDKSPSSTMIPWKSNEKMLVVVLRIFVIVLPTATAFVLLPSSRTTTTLVVPPTARGSSFSSRKYGPFGASTLPLTTESDLANKNEQVVVEPATPPILPAREPLSSFFYSSTADTEEEEEQFSILSWNILLPNSQDNWWCHKQYASTTPMHARQWEHRRYLIKERLLQADADIVCIQEADGDTFDQDFDFMTKDAGYDCVLHKKFRFRCATFYRRDKFTLDQVAHKDRTLVTSLKSLSETSNNNNSNNTTTRMILNIVNCHLSGGAAPERRLRQVHDGLEQIRKWNDALERKLAQLSKHKRPSPKQIAMAEQALNDFEMAGNIVCGDFNSDGNTAVRKLLVEGCVTPDWREPQYPSLQLTSKKRQHSLGRGGNFYDAAELAYQSNVCDGDYGHEYELPIGESNSAPLPPARPPTYVVPNLASLLLLPVGGGSGSQQQQPPRTQFGNQIAKGLADTLDLKDFCDMELDRAFDQVDHDKNGFIDQDEIQTLLESAYVATYGQQIEQERTNFFYGFGTNNNNNNNQGSNDDNSNSGLTKEQFITRLEALQQDREGDRKAFALARGLGGKLQKLSTLEMEQAFERIDLDGNGLLDETEFQTLLETVYVAIYGKEIEQQRKEFFAGFHHQTAKGGGEPDNDSNQQQQQELTREQFTDRLLALHQELEGGRNGSELAEVRTEADAKIMIERFTPLLRGALDEVFDKFSSNAITLSQEEVNDFLVKTNGELGRGGTFRHTTAMFQKKIAASKPPELTRQDWYGVFARELAEGKWWQVVYDLEVCGSNVSSQHNTDGSPKKINTSSNQFYQGWLDYVYFQGLSCKGVQDVLTDEERSRVYKDGDAFPNSWHPSDHLPVAAVFSWKKR